MKIKTEILDGGKLFVNSTFLDILTANGLTSCSAIWNVSSSPVKKVVRERGTEKLFLKDPQSGEAAEYYIKRCGPIPLKQKIKSALSLKFKHFDALNEWSALLRFHDLGLNTMTPVAAGKMPGGYSFVLSLGIRNYRRASKIFPEFGSDVPSCTRKKNLVVQIASLAGKMHSADIAHQDFYLVHIFVLNDTYEIYLIDLQRALMPEALPPRWIVKDLAQLYFSAADYINNDDISLFVSEYGKYFPAENPLDDKRLVNAIIRKAGRIKEHTAKIYSKKT